MKRKYYASSLHIDAWMNWQTIYRQYIQEHFDDKFYIFI